MLIPEVKAARRPKVLSDTPGPLRCLVEEAGSSFIVHGHRLPSLYRRCIRPPRGFIVPKISKDQDLHQGVAPGYLQNNETGDAG